jgi:hypothetical protein
MPLIRHQVSIVAKSRLDALIRHSVPPSYRATTVRKVRTLPVSSGGLQQKAGQREQPVYLRCCECGGERADLEFTEQLAA